MTSWGSGWWPRGAQGDDLVGLRVMGSTTTHTRPRPVVEPGAGTLRNSQSPGNSKDRVNLRRYGSGQMAGQHFWDSAGKRGRTARQQIKYVAMVMTLGNCPITQTVSNMGGKKRSLEISILGGKCKKTNIVFHFWNAVEYHSEKVIIWHLDRERSLS